MQNFVVGIDFTDRSRASLREAVRLAAHSKEDAMVHALHVVEGAAMEDLRAAAQGGREEVEGRVLLDTKRLMESYIAEGGGAAAAERGAGVKLIVEVRIGDPAHEIAEYAQQVEADLIVMSRNSRSDPKRGAGSTAVQTVRHAKCDVLIVREGRGEVYRSVVSCVDFSEHSDRAIRAAAAMARRDGAELHLVHAYRPYWEVIHLGALPMDATSEVQNEQRRILEQRLGRLAKAAQESAGDREVKWHIVPAGSAASALIEFLEDANADLAVVASHGRTGLSRVFIGSVAERIVRDSPCTVLVCKAKETV